MPQEEMVAARSHSKLLAAQTCSRGGARSLRGPQGGGRLPLFSQPREGRSWLGSPRLGVKGTVVPAEGRACTWKEALTRAEGRQETKLGGLNLILL